MKEIRIRIENGIGYDLALELVQEVVTYGQKSNNGKFCSSLFKVSMDEEIEVNVSGKTKADCFFVKRHNSI